RRLLGGRGGLGGGLSPLLPRRRGGGGRRGRCDGVALDLDGAGGWHSRGGAGGSRPLRGLGNVQHGTDGRLDDADRRVGRQARGERAVLEDGERRRVGGVDAVGDGGGVVGWAGGVGVLVGEGGVEC